MIDPEKWNEIKANMPVEPYVDNEDDYVLLVEEVERVTKQSETVIEGCEMSGKIMLKQIESLTEANDKLEDKISSLKKDMAKQDVYISEINQVHRIKIASLTEARDEYKISAAEYKAKYDQLNLKDPWQKVTRLEAENARLKSDLNPFRDSPQIAELKTKLAASEEEVNKLEKLGPEDYL